MQRWSTMWTNGAMYHCNEASKFFIWYIRLKKEGISSFFLMKGGFLNMALLDVPGKIPLLREWEDQSKWCKVKHLLLHVA